MLNKIMISFLILVLGSGLGYGWRMIQQPPQTVALVVDFSGEAKQYIEERETDFNKAVKYHGERETYYMWDGKLWLVRDDRRINAVETIKGVEK